MAAETFKKYQSVYLVIPQTPIRISYSGDEEAFESYPFSRIRVIEGSEYLTTWAQHEEHPKGSWCSCEWSPWESDNHLMTLLAQTRREAFEVPFLRRSRRRQPVQTPLASQSGKRHKINDRECSQKISLKKQFVWWLFSKLNCRKVFTNLFGW